jgi:hypothetical protein
MTYEGRLNFSVFISITLKLMTLFFSNHRPSFILFDFSVLLSKFIVHTVCIDGTLLALSQPDNITRHQSLLLTRHN